MTAHGDASACTGAVVRKPQAFNAGKGGHLKPESDRLQIGKWRSSNGGETGLSKFAVVAYSSTGDPEMGDYDDEPTVFFRKGQLPAAFY